MTAAPIWVNVQAGESIHPEDAYNVCEGSFHLFRPSADREYNRRIFLPCEQCTEWGAYEDASEPVKQAVREATTS